MAKSIFGLMAAVALVAAPAQANCWSDEEASAATVRELQSMLMVTALRCQVTGHAIMAEYNEFVVANRAAIGAMNDRLKAHFIHEGGAVGGQRAYDAYTTSAANYYGAGASGTEACASASSVAREGGLMAGSIEGLLLLAERTGVAPRLSDRRCGEAAPALVVASNTVVIPGPGEAAR